MASSKQNFVFLTRFIRNLRGGSQPILAEASDGQVYVCKFADNVQGPNLLFNEAAGTELYRACGLPVASWRPVWVSDEFLDRYPTCWIQTSEGSRRPAIGHCFAARYLGGTSQNLFEILPGSYLGRIQNARDFWLAWLVDVCASHADNRQALFLEREPRELDAVFIDFGHMFGGAQGLQTPQSRGSQYRDSRIYREPKAGHLMTIRRIADNLNHNTLWLKVAAIPDAWKSQTASEAFAACLNRLADSEFVNGSLDEIVRTIGICTDEGLAPGNAKRLPISVLPASIRVQGQVCNAAG